MLGVERNLALLCKALAELIHVTYGQFHGAVTDRWSRNAADRLSDEAKVFGNKA